MMLARTMLRGPLVLILLASVGHGAYLNGWQDTAAAQVGDVKAAPDGWEAAALREEIRPAFAFDPKGGDGKGALIIKADAREGLAGFWKKTFPVSGGKHYHFAATYEELGVDVPRRSVVVEIHWRDAQGKKVPADEPWAKDYLIGARAMAETEFPTSREVCCGFTEVADTYQVPARATQAIVELHLRWAAKAEVRWSAVTFKEVPPPPERKVRLATVHFIPKGGKTPMDNCRMYEPFIAEAAAQKADLVVLGETITIVNMNKKYHEVAEPIPGPSSDYFCELAKKHQIHIVVGLVEREGHLVYNVAILIGPDGRIIGKYRKVCLPRRRSKRA